MRGILEDWVFAVYGEGRCADLVANLARKYPDRFWFAGRAVDSDTLADAYATADVFISLSTTETLGRTYLEAFSRGLGVKNPGIH